MTEFVSEFIERAERSQALMGSVASDIKSSQRVVTEFVSEFIERAERAKRATSRLFKELWLEMWLSLEISKVLESLVRVFPISHFSHLKFEILWLTFKNYILWKDCYHINIRYIRKNDINTD